MIKHQIDLLMIHKIVDKITGQITELKPNDKIVYSYLLSCQGVGLTVNRIALDNGLSDSTVKRTIKTLKSCGLLTAESTKQEGRKVTQFNPENPSINNFKYYQITGNELFIN